MLAPGVLSNPWVQEDASMDEIVDVDMDVKVDADERVDAGLYEKNLLQDMVIQWSFFFSC